MPFLDRGGAPGSARHRPGPDRGAGGGVSPHPDATPAGDAPAGLDPARYGKDLEWYRRTLVDLYRGVLEAGNGDVIVDSSKFPSYAFLLHQTGEIDLQVIHLVRDPRAVAFSWRRDKVDPDAPGGERMKKLPSFVTGLYWSAWNLAIERISKAQGIPRLLVRYEDFVASPRSTMEQIAGGRGSTDRPLPFVSDTPSQVGSEPCGFWQRHTIRSRRHSNHRGRRLVPGDGSWRPAGGVGL